LFEFAELAGQGLLAVLNDEGELLEKVVVPTGPEITGVRFVPPGESGSQMVCLVTEGCFLHQISFRGEKQDLQSESDELSTPQQKK
jgi:hypothetical protein